ncbi:MAG: type I-E CRISPR-associated endoribonuclease Cas2e [Deltaproteobacteria bacterium]|nr:type I-E CRISPR-associated endoribonuclease Cas2e [Deltaproteobacteria bacterium]
MTLVVTRNVPDRFRGFLASVMCEVTWGVYTAPRISKGVRDRIWDVLCEWYAATSEPDRGIVMTWPDARVSGGQVFRTLGSPKVDLHEHDGLILVRCELTAETERSLTIHAERNAPRPPAEDAESGESA